MSLYHYLATSDGLAPRAARAARRAARGFTLPAPRVLVRPALWAFLAARSLYHFGLRVFVCEPLFKASCRRYGRGVRTGNFLHWVDGKGDIVLGDGVVVDGKCSFSFAARFADRPTFEVGDHTVIGHNGQFTIGQRITIGRHCLIAGNVCMYDSDGHPSDPAARLAGLPPTAETVRPIVLADNVWVGNGAIILKGVTVGAGSIVGAGAVVTKSVPPNVLVAGNPARVVKSLTEPWRANGDRAPHLPPAAPIETAAHESDRRHSALQ